jgi:hypothetical protein
VPFWYVVCGRQLCAFLVGVGVKQFFPFLVRDWWLAVICLSGRALVGGYYVPFW